MYRSYFNILELIYDIEKWNVSEHYAREYIEKDLSKIHNRAYLQLTADTTSLSIDKQIKEWHKK